MNIISSIKWLTVSAAISIAMTNTTLAHFQMIIPSDDMIKQDEPRKLQIDARFWHPLEGYGMAMDKPVQFGVMHRETKIDLMDQLRAVKQTDKDGKAHVAYAMTYELKRPGDYIFYTEPAPYWEPAESAFIVHYTKTIVNGFGLEEGWDTELGLKTEIVPLTRPYGLWEGNVFQGIVKVNGQAVPFSDVEIEYYDETGMIQIPADPMITQVVKADANGVFTYAMPWGGWWGFAALNEDDEKLQHEGKEYPVEIGAVLWVFTHPKPH